MKMKWEKPVIVSLLAGADSRNGPYPDYAEDPNTFAINNGLLS